MKKRKNLMAMFLISSLSISTLIGCGQGTPTKTLEKEDKTNIETNIENNEEILTKEENKELKELESDPLHNEATMQKSRYGLTGIYVYDLVEIFEDGLDFFIYVENSENENENLSNALKWGIEENNIECENVGLYLVDFSSLNSAEQDKLLEYFIPGTVYAVSNREIVSSFTKIPEDDIDNYQEEYNKLFSNWIYSTKIGINDYGLKIINMEEITKKIENKEEFALYIGRPSCKYCRIFTPQLEEIVKDENNQINIPIYYFYTQDYKNKINDEKGNAQEEWDKVKETLGIQYTPSFVVYKGEEKIQYDNFIGDDYFDTDKDNKVQLLEDGKNDFLKFLQENGLLEKTEVSSVEIDVDSKMESNESIAADMGQNTDCEDGQVENCE